MSILVETLTESAWSSIRSAFVAQGLLEGEVEEGMKGILNQYNRALSLHKHQDQYAEVMVQCMVRFLSGDEAKARATVSSYRADCGDMFTHDDPFETACHLAGVHARPKIDAIMEKFETEYDELAQTDLEHDEDDLWEEEDDDEDEEF
jgi:hypothetical protein